MTATTFGVPPGARMYRIEMNVSNRDEGKVMGTVIQFSERSTGPDHTSADADQAEADHALRESLADQIATATSAHETLGQSIDTLHRCLKALDDIVETIADPAIREEFQRRMKSIDALLSPETAKLSGMQMVLQAAVSLS
jgi:hypothetical protein